MARTIQFKLGDAYTRRLDALVARLGLKRPLLVRNLLSLDKVLIDDIEDKAKSLEQVDIFESKASSKGKLEKVPEIITVILDEEQDRRFNALAKSLGVNTKVQVLRNLLSGDPRTVATVCQKAKLIPHAPAEEIIATHTSIPEVFEKTKVVNSMDAIEELIRKKVFEFEKELRAIVVEQGVISDIEVKIPQQEEAPSIEPSSASTGSSSISLQHANSQVGDNLFPKLESENKQASSKTKGGKGRPKKDPSSVDHSEERRQIVEYFNLKSGRNLGYDTVDSAKVIDKMLDKGKSIREFMTIIDHMCHWWKDVDPDMYSNLFPETLFRPSHWDKYLVNNPAPPKGPKDSKKPPVNHKYDDFYL